MKKHLRSMLALLMALLMVMSFSVSVSAAAPDPASDLSGKTVILSSNDVHGAIDKYQYMKGLKDAYEKAGATVYAVDCGDYTNGDTTVSYSKGADAVTLMNAAGYDISTLGNHEFDFGRAQLKDNLSKADFDVICADVFDEEGNPLFDEYVVKESGGIKIGFFGLETPEAQTKVNPAGIKGLKFLTNDTVPTLYGHTQEIVNELKAQGADVIVAVTHLGVDAESEPYRSSDMFKAVEGVDIVLDGHSHTVMEQSDDGEPIMSTGTKFANIGVTVIDNETKSIEEWGLMPVEGLPGDEDVEAVADEIIKAVEEAYGAVVAKSEVLLNGERSIKDGVYGNRDGETNLGNLITDSFIWYVTQDPDTDLGVDPDKIVAITNGGGIRAPIAVGDITLNDINKVLPFGNTLTAVYVKGDELLEALEASTFCTPTSVGGFPQIAGMNINIDVSAAYDANAETYPESTYYGPASINRVEIKDVNGKPLDPNAVYCVLTNDFCAAGGDTYYAFKAATSQFDTCIPMDEVLAEYIRTGLGGIVGEEYADVEGRITQVPYTALQTIEDFLAMDGSEEGYNDAAIAAKEAYNSIKDEFKAEFSADEVTKILVDGSEAEAASAKEEAAQAKEEAAKATEKVEAVVALANDVIASAAVNKNNYKAATAAAFTTALDAAKAALANESATVEELTKADADLAAAKAALVPKAANTLNVSGKKPAVKAKKKQTVTAGKAYKFTSKGEGTLKYTLSSAKKGSKSFKKYFKVDAKTGKITVKKGLKKGTYTVKVTVAAAGNGDYKAGSKTATVKIKVK